MVCLEPHIHTLARGKGGDAAQLQLLGCSLALLIAAAKGWAPMP